MKGVGGWRYEVQREHVRGESPFYSLMAAPPYMPNGFITGYKASYAIRPIVDDSDGTWRGVMRVIRRHQKYVASVATGGEHVGA